jgi:hypothetical protein
MRSHLVFCWLLSLQILLGFHAKAADIVWTKTTGQYPVECAPVIAKTGNHSAAVAVNRGGEVMVWGLDGADIFGGTDGKVAQLPKGVWSSSPAVIPAAQGGGIVVCNVKGLVVALDAAFQPRWKYQLPGETSFSCAAPAVMSVPGKQELGFVLSDQSGTVTCLDMAGKVVWQTPLGTGECDALVAVLEEEAATGLLASAGTQLHRLDSAGKTLWSHDLKANVSSQAQVLWIGDRPTIFCGTVAGDLHALSMDGNPVWTASVGDEVGNTITMLERPDDPLILCTGLWGNLYALDRNGRRVWTHMFRSKNRGTPAIDFQGDGNQKIVLTTYSQHVYMVDQKGNLVDDARLSGCINGSPLLLDDFGDPFPEVLTVDASLLAHRVRVGAPKSVYGPAPAPEGIELIWPASNAPGEEAAVTVLNPKGGLLCANLRGAGAEGEIRIQGMVASRSAFEISMPGGELKVRETWQCVVRDTTGNVVAEGSWTVPAPDSVPEAPAAALRAWATPAYGLFDAQRLTPCSREGGEVRLSAVYQDEVEQGAFIIASELEAPCRVHMDVTPFKTAGGKPFIGTVSLHELVPTGTVNGERVPDALLDLGDARVATIQAKSAGKFWLGVDARNAGPGEYTAKMVVEPLYREAPAIELAVTVEVLPLRIPNPLPLSVCAWDYVPNKWFPDRTTEVIDDMQRHGVNIFPRTGPIPKGSVDAAGQLSMDWTDLDVDLKRYEGRGTILFQLTEPPITFTNVPDAAKKRETQIQFLVEWRNYLKAHGREYGDYAFYPVDEPGLGYGGNNVQLLIDSATLFLEADAKFRVYTDPVPGLSLADYKRLEPLIDVWCPNMRLMSGGLCGDPRVAGILGSGKTVWSYECVSQVRSLSPLCYNRANPWRGDFFGLSGIGYWTHSTTQVNEWFPGKGINDEYALVYPGPLPVSSVRWEAVRDGLEDVAAARMLQDAANAPGADPALSGQALDELRMAHTDMMELSDAAFIESRDFLRAGDRRIWHNWTDAENCTRHRERMAELTIALTGQGGTAEP